MSSAANTLIGNDWEVLLGSDASPPEYAQLCAAFDFGQIGEEKPLVDTTTYCDNARAYRNGLADGTEIPLQLNYVSGDALAKQLYDAYKNDELVAIRISKKAASPAEYFEFLGTVRAWNVTGPIGEKSVLQFTLKVSGEVLWVTA